MLLTILSQLEPSALDHIVIVGGLVPSLLVDADQRQIEPHVGTFDLDLGVEVAVDNAYERVAAHLREQGFKPESANPIRWSDPAIDSVYVDLLPVGLDEDQQIVAELPPTISRPLRLAFKDRICTRLQGNDLHGREIAIDANVCGPGAYVAIKALTFDDRQLNKDAYDLYFVLHYYGSGVQDVADRLRPLLQDTEAKRALRVLSSDFCVDYERGCEAVARFLFPRPDEALQADVAGDVLQLLNAFGGPL
jgi:hypothetical protein